MTGIDISDVAIKRARQNYGEFADFHVMDAHKMEFESNTFDLIVGRAILHHLDWEIAIREIKRVLKPGGVALFMEPLGDNPVGKIIRKITPLARTLDEQPLSKSQIKFAGRIFAKSHHHFANLISVPIAMITSQLYEDPNNLVLRVANRIDLLAAQTALKYWMRIVVFVWAKN